ncbi:MICOS complex subunit MIC27-like [Glandiceps talaboti]
MAAKITRIARYTIPSAAVFLPVVKANSGESELSQLMKPRQLPIYVQPTPKVEYEFVVEKPNAVQETITQARKHVWKCTESMQGTIDKVKEVWHKAETTTNTVIKYTQTEEGFYPRLVAISMAGMIGVVLGARGGVTKKLIYSGGLMTAATSLCYPHQAVDIAQNTYDKAKDKITQVYEGRSKKTETKPQKETKTPVEPKTAAPVKQESVKPSTKPVPKEDLGQSTPEDKDMYTTRS